MRSLTGYGLCLRFAVAFRILTRCIGRPFPDRSCRTPHDNYPVCEESCPSSTRPEHPRVSEIQTALGRREAARPIPCRDTQWRDRFLPMRSGPLFIDLIDRDKAAASVGYDTKFAR